MTAPICQQRTFKNIVQFIKQQQQLDGMIQWVWTQRVQTRANVYHLFHNVEHTFKSGSSLVDTVQLMCVTRHIIKKWKKKIILGQDHRKSPHTSLLKFFVKKFTNNFLSKRLFSQYSLDATIITTTWDHSQWRIQLWAVSQPPPPPLTKT